MDQRIHQRKDGTRYVRSEEFVESDEGQELLDRFSESVEEESEPDSDASLPQPSDSSTYPTD